MGNPYKRIDVGGRAVEEWASRGLCAQLDPDMWFEVENARLGSRSPSPSVLKRAKAVCSRCPVRLECLEAGKGQAGIWGGLTVQERRARPRRRKSLG